MSVNRREEVLTRLSGILGEIAGIETNARNRGLLDNDALPATILLDGDETTKTLGRSIGGATHGRTGMSTSIVTMHPQIFVVQKLKTPKNENVGQSLNTFRGLILKAVAADAQLLAIIGPNGGISYESFETDLKNGMSLEGQMQVNLAITVPCDPNV